MPESEHQPPTNTEDLYKLANKVFNATQELLNEFTTKVVPTTKIIRERIEEFALQLTRIDDDIRKLRTVFLGKVDGLQGTVDLIRQDIRNAWTTADFSITNSTHMRDETSKILEIISTMQRQQQLLESQVDELRKKAAEKEADL